MKRDWFEQDRFDFSRGTLKEQGFRVVKAMGLTLFVFFAPAVLVANMWVFYTLYEGIGFAITVGVSTILFAGIFGYLDTRLTSIPHSQPSTLAWLYLLLSLLLHLLIVALF